MKGGAYARAISHQTAISLARENHAFIEYDYTAQAPFFYYRDASQKQHVVWFEDARSIQAKFDLLKELSLRGVSYWKLGWVFRRIGCCWRTGSRLLKNKRHPVLWQMLSLRMPECQGVRSVFYISFAPVSGIQSPCPNERNTEAVCPTGRPMPSANALR